MSTVEQLRQLWRHAVWANAEILRALQQHTAPANALREFAHVLAVEEVWLSRLEERPARSPLWPEMSIANAEALSAATSDAYEQYLGGLTDERLRHDVSYTNSQGQSFTTPVGDILLQVALHGQYHRGKVNLLLRQGGHEPAPVDYIGFVRGVPAARTELSPPPSAPSR
jgi:uncharacterized damage-inducible protein DinB